jgi:uroporphyrinogen decarboxylase
MNTTRHNLTAVPLTQGERFIRCMTGEPIDRVPFGIGLGWYPWGQTVDRWRQETGQPDLNVSRALHYEGDNLAPKMHAGVWPTFERKVIEETQDFITWRDERGITKRDRRDGLSMPDFLDYPVKCRRDWDALKAERLAPDASGRVEQDWDAFRARLTKEGLAVRVGDYPFGVFGTPRDLLGAEELLVAFYDGPDMIRDMMDHLTSLWLHVWEQVAQHVQIDQIHIWEDMSGKQGSLISPAMVREFMMPCYDRIADFAKRHGVRVISVDTDGNCGELVPLMMAHGVNVFMPFEIQAGNDLFDYRRRYPALGITGGLDKRALARDRAAIDIEIDKARRMISLGRYIPMFDHLIPPDVSWENMKYAAQRIREVCLETRIT